MNLALSSITDEVMELPVVEDEWHENVRHDIFEADPQIAAEDIAMGAMLVRPNDDSVGGTWFGRSLANLVGCVIVLDHD